VTWTARMSGKPKTDGQRQGTRGAQIGRWSWSERSSEGRGEHRGVARNLPWGDANGRPGRRRQGGIRMPVTAPEGATRTAILTVDDDPGVSRAVARDLRRRYGEQHRIVRAESGDAALEALRQLKLRGDTVAIILADYRMPQMNGIEFLE